MKTPCELPPFLRGRVSQSAYCKWLRSKAHAHLRRYRWRRKAHTPSTPHNKLRDAERAIHNAVLESEGLDVYTGQPLAWELLRQYTNVASQAEGRAYKRRFANLPTVDHEGDGFRICAWSTNDAKHDLSYSAFLALCTMVVRHAEGSHQ